MALNIAFAGFRHGHILGLYNLALENKDVVISGCFENVASEKEKVIKDHGIVFSYESYEEILNDQNVDAIAIGDYYAKRGQMVIDALKRGKHVICDKPVCTDLDELSEIEKLSKEKNLCVCCMFDLRYMAQVSKVKELVDSGEIGKLHISSFTGQHCLDYGNRPGWYFEEGKHGGTINDIAIHGIDLLRFITGKNLTNVNCAKTWNAFADKEPEFKDSAQLMIEMEDMSVMADVSYAAPKCSALPTYWDFYLWGTKGMINFKLNENVIHLYKEKEEIIECEPVAIGYLDDFIKETQDIDTMMNTKSVIDSQRQVLLIQKATDCK
ncbi:MAG: Gfo/Idh/MocA family oxidoreductase [Clostridia bacterium]|nr:Gfo/Idh/MocA family oxidoreductase [Clostridia bacterium]